MLNKIKIMTVRRIKINLSNIFSDYRKFAYITIDSKWDAVADLELHIVNLFGIKSKIYLTTDDGILIPSKETIDIMSLEDSIMVHLMEHHDELVEDQTHLDISQSSKDDAQIKQKRKRKRHRKNKQIIVEVCKDIAEENGFDDEYEDETDKRVAKMLNRRDSFKAEDEVVVEPVAKEIPKLNIISSLPKIVYGI